jgi:threonylcarbamoyladenosine tRNA methylthiotransferase MtaB
MKIAVLTLGCRTNQAESAQLEERLGAAGHQTTRKLLGADVVVINSCSVTSRADQQSRQLISKALRTSSKVIVTGCYVALNMERLIQEAGNVTIVSNNNKDDIIDMIPDAASQTSTGDSSVRRHRPIIKVQDGCNNSCSYCIIPTARGLSRSISPEKVLDEVLKYESQGYQEVVLSGIHLGNYGYDLLPASNLTKLLQFLLNKTVINRIRLSSIEISEVTDGILELMYGDRICHHLHIPLQGTTDKMLINMNRAYTIDKYRHGLDRILEKNENIGLGTDIMVGFPGETEADYEMSLSTISAMPFSYLHVFPYSRRPGTVAYNMPYHVPAPVKKERSRRMAEIGSLKRVNFIRRNMDSEQFIIVESFKDGTIVGTTSNYIKVIIDSSKEIMPGKLMKVKITRQHDTHAAGVPLNFP